MITDNNPANEPRPTFEGIRAKYGLTSEDLSSLRKEIDLVLPDVLKAAGINQDLSWDHVLTLEGLGPTNVPKILDAIERSKTRPLARVLFALGILHIGSEMAELLAQNFASIDELAAASEEDLTAVPGIGPKIAASVTAYFSVEDNRRVIEKLRDAGVRLEAEPLSPEAGDLPLRGKTFCLTGTLSTISRSQAQARIKALGGAVSSSVTRNTTHLVAGESPGSKLATAEKLGTTILNEKKFLKLLKAQGAGV